MSTSNNRLVGRGVEDLLCGIIGYGIGKYQAQKNISTETVEQIINGFLRQTSLEDLIDFWMQDNGFTGGCEGYVCNKLREKADKLEDQY